MKRAGHQSHRLLIALMALLFVTSFMPTSWTRPLVSLPRTAIDTVTTPFTVYLRAAGDAVTPDPLVAGTPPEDMANIDWYAQFRLEKQLSERLQIENDELRRWMRQFEELDRMVGPDAFRVQPAYVTSYVGGDTPRITIDRGYTSGLARGQAVIHGDHVVGIVESAGPVTARVAPLLASPTSLRVFFTPQRAGERERPGNDLLLEPNESRNAFVGNIERGVDVQPGYLAVLADMRYPGANFFLGVVDSVTQSEDDMRFDRVTVTPEVRPDRVSQLVVLVPINTEDTNDN